MTGSKFIPVHITFATDEKQFGGWFYNATGDLGERKVNLPFLKLWLSDRDGQKAELLYTTLRDAIMSGRKVADVRFWKKKGEGLMTQLDREHGYSYEVATRFWGWSHGRCCRPLGFQNGLCLLTGKIFQLTLFRSSPSTEMGN